MSRRLTGTVYEASGKWYARMTIRGQRESILLSTCNDRESAEARTGLLANFAKRLREAKREDVTLQLLDHAATLENHKLDDVRRAVDLIVQGKVVRTREGNAPTVRELGERWTRGDLAREYPDHVKAKRSAEHDRGRLEMYVYPVIGNIPIDKLTLEHAQLVMRGVPIDLAAGTRRQVAQLLHRLCAMAVFPMCLRQTNPLPRGFLPKVGPDKAKGWIYPDEDAQLIGSSAVPLEWRMFYGFLHREGTRRSEAGALTWSDIDLERGVVVLDENKTNDPRAWALSPGVSEALCTWRELRARKGEDVGDDARVFVDEEGEPISGRMADQYREHLRAAGIARPVLFEQSKSRQRVRLHDTRATFVTVSLANGRSEAWVQDRTGHKSSTMIAKYRRAARMALEVGMGPLVRMDVAVGLAGYVGEAEAVAVLH